jgi:hypothetical protein
MQQQTEVNNMIDVKELTNSDGKLKDGYHLSPDFTTEEYEEEPWDLYNTEDCLKELRRLQRTKGRKHINILLGFGDHMRDWVEVSWKLLYDMVRDRQQRYANCEYNQLWYLKNSYRTHISVWPTYLRDSNKTVDNRWGEQEEE